MDADAAPSISVQHIAHESIGYRRFVARCGVFYAVSRCPYRAAAKAVAKCRSEPYPYWRNHRHGDMRPWAGARMGRRDPIETHRWILENER